jgi:hypothetical protein
MIDKRVVVVLLFGLCMWYIGGAQIVRLRALVDACVMAELVSRTFKHKC